MRLTIEVAQLHKNLSKVAAVSVALLLALSSCKAMQTSYATTAPEPTGYEVPFPTEDTLASGPVVSTEPTTEPDPWTEDDVYQLALTLAGECYDDKELDKRKVCEVVLNRVSDGRFGGDTIY